MKGKLFLIPTTLGESSPETVIPKHVFDIINETEHFIVENVRTARRYLIKIGIKKAIDDLTFYTLNKHTKPEELTLFTKAIEEGFNVGIISEAGTPGVADPGADIVKIAHQKNIQVVPLVGPSSILLALMASGMNGQNFAFAGYLPIKKHERSRRIQELEKRSRMENQTQIFIEAPYRNMQLLEDMLQSCNPNTTLCIATDITLDKEFIQTKSIAQWKKRKPDINKRPTIFLMHYFK